MEMDGTGANIAQQEAKQSSQCQAHGGGFSREKKYLEGFKQWWQLDSTSITEETAVFVQRRAVRV